MNKLREARMKSMRSQKEVAISLNVSKQSVSMWESGARTPSSENYIKLAELYGVSVDYLLRDGQEQPKEEITTKKEETPVHQDERSIDDTLLSMLMDLNPAEVQRVKDFVYGMQSSRK